MQEDRALLKRWREGDGKAGEELFRRHFADVFRFFDSKVSAHAEDLSRQTFIACLKSPDGLSREPSFACFLFAIAWRELRRHLSGELNNEPVDFEVSSLNEITGRIGSPSSQLHRAQQSQFVHQALARLGHDVRLTGNAPSLDPVRAVDRNRWRRERTVEGTVARSGVVLRVVGTNRLKQMEGDIRADLISGEWSADHLQDVEGRIDDLEREVPERGPVLRQEARQALFA